MQDCDNEGQPKGHLAQVRTLRLKILVEKRP